MRNRRFLLFVLAAFFLFLFIYDTFFKPVRVPERNPRYKGNKIKKTSVYEKSVYIRYGDTDALTVFSAYLHSDAIFVILGSYGYFSRRVFCRYFGNEREEIVESIPKTVFPEFVVKCDVVSEARFIAISIDGRDEVHPGQMHPIVVDEEDFRHSFSICLAPIYGKDPKWLNLVEFFEFYKLQGADHFYIYVLDYDNPSTKHVISSYKQEGIAEVIKIKNSTGCLNRHRCRHEVQLQDCVYRSRGHSSWVTTVDLDERITPSDGKSLKEYTRSHGSRLVAELRFRCRWVLRLQDIPSNFPKTWKDVRKHLPTLKWHNTSYIAPLNHTTKSVIDPLKVGSMGVHQGLRFAPGTDVFLVPPEDAVVRHYRLQKGWSSFLKEAESFGMFTNTSLDEELQAQLTKNVHSKLCRLWKRFC